MSWLLIISSYSISFLSRPNVTSMLKNFFNSISNEQIYSWLFTRAIQALINATAHKTAVSRIGHSSKLICDFTTQVIRLTAPLEQIVRYINYLRTATETWRLAVFCGINNTTAKWRKKNVISVFTFSLATEKVNLKYIIYKSNIYCQ